MTSVDFDNIIELYLNNRPVDELSIGNKLAYKHWQTEIIFDASGEYSYGIEDLEFYAGLIMDENYVPVHAMCEIDDEYFEECIIDWGDGITSVLTQEDLDNEDYLNGNMPIHTYSEPGVYHIKIDDSIKRFSITDEWTYITMLNVIGVKQIGNHIRNSASFYNMGFVNNLSDINLCRLQVLSDYSFYDLWNNEGYIEGELSSPYILSVCDNACSNTDIQVEDFDVYFPNLKYIGNYNYTIGKNKDFFRKHRKIEYIGEQNFDFSNIDYIYLNDKTKFSKGTFRVCPYVISIELDENNPYYNLNNGLLKDENNDVYAVDNSKLNINNGLLNLNFNNFYGGTICNNDILSIRFDNNVSINVQYTFQSCDNLTDIDLSNVQINSNATIQSCPKLSSLTYYCKNNNYSENCFIENNYGYLKNVYYPQLSGQMSIFSTTNNIQYIYCPDISSTGNFFFRNVNNLLCLDFSNRHRNNVVQLNSTSFYNFNPTHQVSVYVPTSLSSTWRNASYWKSYFDNNKMKLIGV